MQTSNIIIWLYFTWDDKKNQNDKNWQVLCFTHHKLTSQIYSLILAPLFLAVNNYLNYSTLSAFLRTFILSFCMWNPLSWFASFSIVWILQHFQMLTYELLIPSVCLGIFSQISATIFVFLVMNSLTVLCLSLKL